MIWTILEFYALTLLFSTIIGAAFVLLTNRKPKPKQRKSDFIEAYFSPYRKPKGATKR